MQFQGGGGSYAEFAAAQGTKSAFDSTFRLVGDTADNGLKVTSVPFGGVASNGGEFTAAVATNVKTAVQSALTAAGGTSLYVRIDFNASNYASLSALTLKMQYDDGYVAFLNGVEVASENAPLATLTWNSLANEEQTSDVQATTYENVDLSSFLTNGKLSAAAGNANTLAIQVLLSSNSLTTDGDMLVVPELGQMTSVIGGDHIFSTPTPGAANALGNVQPDIGFSTTHGFFYAQVQVTLTPDITASPIYYTTDNSVPSAANITQATESGSTVTITTSAPMIWRWASR